MMNKKVVKFIALLCCFLLLMSVVVPALIFVAYADSALDKLQTEYDKIIKEQNALKKDINKDTANKKTAATKKNQIEKEVSGLQSKISLINNIISELSKSIEQKERESLNVQGNMDDHTQIYLNRVRENYEKGSVSPIDILFGSSSFSEMLTKLDNEQAIMMYDKQLITDMKVEKNEILSIKATIEENKKKQEALKSETLEDKKELEVKVKEQNSLIKEIEGDIKEKQALYNDLEEAEKLLDKEITKYLASLAASDFVGGKFIWPTPGYTKITSKFGPRTHPVTGKKNSFHSGIDIGAAGGSKILAANGGKVVKSTYNSAYGNYILIDHGGGYATMYAHSREVFVKVGDVVKQGQKIAAVGTTGMSTGNHLHFEVRVNGVSQDPTKYVSSNNK